MKYYEIEISDQADQDLRGIYTYIAFELLSPENAADQLNRLETAIAGLDSFPEIHRQFQGKPWKGRNLRVMPVDNYLVFYIPNHKTLAVKIVRVIYSGRDVSAQLKRFTQFDNW